jgi:hypothetical protein
MLRSLKYVGVAAVMSLGPWLLTDVEAQVGQPPDAEARAAALKRIKNQNLDPEGEPAEFKKSASERFAVWRDRKGWHLLATAGGQTRRFKGQVRVEGGTLEKVSSYKTEGDFPAGAHWKLSPTKHELTFDFQSDKRLDGIRFRVNKDALAVGFTLSIDGITQPQLVYVGQKNQYPEVLPFILPAQPRQVKAGK